MRISAVSSQMYQPKVYSTQHRKAQNESMLKPAKNDVAFKGWCGALIGGSVGAVVGVLLAPVTGGASLLAAYYAGAAVGGYAGHKIEGDD